MSIAGTETESKLLAAALRYASWRWHVFPLNGKLPITEHGCKDATTDADTIRQWWKQSPNANIGIATGAASAIFVVDVDGECELPDALQNLPPTIAAKTTKGRHLFFRYPDGRKIGNRTKVNKLPIDIRGEGGYVVGVESIHPESKMPYTWINDPDDTQLAEAPTALLDWIDPPRKARQAPPRAAGSPERCELLLVALESRDRMEQARLAIAGDGMTTTTKTTGAVHLNPLLRIEKESRQQFLAAWVSLGLTFDCDTDSRICVE